MAEKKNSSRESKCCGFTEQLERRREERANRNKPQPWIIRKLTVIITAALAIYAYYVYIGRFCVRMIRRDPNAMGGRAMGISFLVVFLLLGFMFWWTYAKSVLTPPGYATDYVKKVPSPGHTDNRPTPLWWDTHYNNDHQYNQLDNSQEPSTRSGNGYPSGKVYQKPNDIPVGEKLQQPPQSSVHRDAEASATDGTLVPGAEPQGSNERTPNEPQRRPHTYPVLAPEYRYCRRDQIVKPMRTHHCRQCGKCVLQYDHHCPWVGQCVGAFNHKLFYNFLQWSFLWTSWMFSTLLARNAIYTIDGQEIALIAITGFFVIFSTAMLLAHTRLILLNLTTVESMRIGDMRADEKEELKNVTRLFEFRKRRAIKKRWNREWGELSTEGNIWWMDDTRANWEAVMGKNVWGWFLPIGHSEGDGLTYPINLRFSIDGRWRRRSEWPSELQ